MVRVLFSRSRLPGSYLIRWLTWSDWSHCALYDDTTDTVVEATWPGGVREVPLVDWILDKREWAYRDFAIWPREVIDIARTQVGKKYDWTGIFAFVLQREWQDDRAWFCSELIGWAAMTLLPWRPELVHRVTPQMLWGLR